MAYVLVVIGLEQITEWENYKDIEKENIIKHLKKTSSNSKRQL